MANAVKQRIELGITDAEGKRGILSLNTSKGFNGGTRSYATVTWSDGRFESHKLFGDFNKGVAASQSNRVTQTLIERNHAAAFTSTVIEELTAEAKAFYDDKGAEVAA